MRVTKRHVYLLEVTRDELDSIARGLDLSLAQIYPDGVPDTSTALAAILRRTIREVE